jgi:hypothetical protein
MLKQFNPSNIDAPWHCHLCHGKAMSITYSMCVSAALFILRAKRMLPYFISICSLSGSALFFHISHTRFGRFAQNISHSKEQFSQIFLQMYLSPHVKYSLFLSNFNKMWLFSTYFRKMLVYQFPWKSVQRELCCSILTDGHIDRQAERHDQANSRSSQWCKIA